MTSFDKLKEAVKREAKIIAAAFAIGLCVTAVVSAAMYSERMSSGISSKFIRFHVIANSDSGVDQSLKIKVKDGVLAALKDEVDLCRTPEDTRNAIINSFPLIERASREIIRDEGFDYTAKASLERVMFPTKEYGELVLAAGNYEALRIEIGEAAGRNWWCVVYPPLCYVDVAQGTISENTRNELKNSMSDEEYRLVIKNDGFSFKLKFKIVELWQEGKNTMLAAINR